MHHDQRMQFVQSAAFFHCVWTEGLERARGSEEKLEPGFITAIVSSSFCNSKKKKKNLSPKNQLLQSKVTINLLGGKKEKKIFTDFPKIRQTIWSFTSVQSSPGDTAVEDQASLSVHLQWSGHTFPLSCLSPSEAQYLQQNVVQMADLCLLWCS